MARKKAILGTDVFDDTSDDTSNDIGAFLIALAHAARAWRRVADETLTAYGLSEATSTPLWLIEREGDGLRQGKLAELLEIEGQSLVRLLDHLEEAGLISRRNDPTDRRAKTIHLTPASRPILKKIHKVIDNNYECMLGGLKKEHVLKSLKVFNNIIAVANQAGEVNNVNGSPEISTFCTTLPHAARSCRRAADESLLSYGLSDATAMPLYIIDREGNGLRQCALAELLGIEGQSLVRLLDHLEDAGYISRREDPTDRRAKTIHLTPTGRSMATKVKKATTRNNSRLLAGLTLDEVLIAHKVLNNVISAADSQKH